MPGLGGHTGEALVEEIITGLARSYLFEEISRDDLGAHPRTGRRAAPRPRHLRRGREVRGRAGPLPGLAGQGRSPRLLRPPGGDAARTAVAEGVGALAASESAAPHAEISEPALATRCDQPRLRAVD